MAAIVAIDAAAKAIFEKYSDVRASWTEFEALDYETQDYFRELARAALDVSGMQELPQGFGIRRRADGVLEWFRETNPSTGIAPCQTCGKPSIIRLNDEDMCADCHADYWASQGVGPSREERAELRDAREQQTQFRSCPACRGSGKLDMRCSICEGRGSVDLNPDGSYTEQTFAHARMFGEAQAVATMPTERFVEMRKQVQNEAIEWALRWLTMRAKNLAATQDYLGEHRLNAAVTLMRNDWAELEHGSNG